MQKKISSLNKSTPDRVFYSNMRNMKMFGQINPLKQPHVTTYNKL